MELRNNSDFVHEQREDPTLSHAGDQATTPDQEIGDGARLPQGCRFEIRGDCLYRVVKKPQTAGGPPTIVGSTKAVVQAPAPARNTLDRPPQGGKDPPEGGTAVLLARHSPKIKTTVLLVQNASSLGQRRYLELPSSSCPWWVSL